jgi:hypothetical protein
MYKLLEDERYKEKIKQRILKKCKKDEHSDCIIWTGGKRNGYGAMHMKSTYVPVHRVLYEIFVGPIPKEKIIMHSCDNGLCLNLNHLHLGTIKENNQDRSRKGRTVKTYGEENPNSKLKNEQVKEIKLYLKSMPWNKNTKKILSEKYKITPENINFIRNGITWKEIQ